MLQVGTVVQILRGHDAPGYAAVVELGPKTVWLADGRRRPLERPKRKSLLHIRPTGMVLTAEMLQSNRRLRKALHSNDAAANNP